MVLLQKWVKALAGVLEKEKNTAEKLIALSNEEKKAIAADDSAALEQIINGQQPLLMQFENCEKERLCILDAEGLSGMTLRQLFGRVSAGAAPEGGSNPLEELHKQLSGLTQKLAQINSVNSSLIRLRLEFADSIKAAFLGGGGLYGPAGAKGGPQQNALMDTKA